jgi:dinuclear metal center YbgI/SA1388 family protein
MPETPGVVDRDALVRWLDDYLGAHDGKDYGPNGLQVQGKPEIRKIVTGVSACLELFQKARELEADAVLVHHGIFWDGLFPTLTGLQYHRVAELIKADINLLAYHLPLDRHPEVGNNAVACRALGLEDLQPFGEAFGLPVGWKGRFPTPIPAQELIARCHDFYDREPLAFPEGPDPVDTVGVISGAAQKEFWAAINDGLDAYITGEVSEWVMNVARETATHYLTCGHYATEVCGIKRLGEVVEERFGVDVEFLNLVSVV